MKFKFRYLGRRKGVKCLIKGSFSAENVEEAISIIEQKEIKYNAPVRAYEVYSRKRIIGGKLQ